MKQDIFLIFDKNGLKRSRKTPSYLEKGEISIRIHVKLSDSLFGQPNFESNIVIDSVNSEFDLEIKKCEQKIVELKHQNNELKAPMRDRVE